VKEGWWINTANDNFYKVFEHAHWAQDGDHANKLVGLSKKKVSRLKAYNRHTDNGRYKILTTLMKEGWLRVRGHGNATTFEYWAPNTSFHFACYKTAIERFLSSIGHNSKMVEIYICNLKSKTGIITKSDKLQGLCWSDMEAVDLYY